MELLIIAIVIAAVIALLVWIRKQLKLQKLQRKALLEYIAGKGWHLEEEKIRVLPTEVAMLNIRALHHNGTGDRVWDVIRGEHEGRELLCITHCAEYNRRQNSEAGVTVLLLVQRERQAPPVPDFSLFLGHQVTDAFAALGSLALASNQKAAAFQALDLPPELQRWRIFGVEGTAQWLHDRGYANVAAALDRLNLAPNRSYGVSGSWVFVQDSDLSATMLAEGVEQAQRFADWVSGLDR